MAPLLSEVQLLKATVGRPAVPPAREHYSQGPLRNSAKSPSPCLHGHTAGSDVRMRDLGLLRRTVEVKGALVTKMEALAMHGGHVSIRSLAKSSLRQSPKTLCKASPADAPGRALGAAVVPDSVASREKHQTAIGSSTNQTVEPGLERDNQPEVEAWRFLSHQARQELLLRSQGQSITAGRLPTFIAPTTLTANAPKRQLFAEESSTEDAAHQILPANALTLLAALTETDFETNGNPAIFSARNGDSQPSDGMSYRSLKAMLDREEQALTSETDKKVLVMNEGESKERYRERAEDMLCFGNVCAQAWKAKFLQ